MRKTVALLLFFTATNVLMSQPVHELKKNGGLPYLGKQLKVYEDKEGKLTINDAIGMRDSFYLCKEDIPNFNVTKSAIWLRLKITTDMSSDWRVEAANSSLMSVEFFTVKNNKILKKQRSGLIAPENERALLGGHILFETDLKKGDTIDCYLRVVNSGPMTVPIRAGTMEDFFECDHKTNLMHGLYFGIMLLMVFYNLFLFITNRSLVYVYYIFYIIFSAFFIAFFLGYVLLLPGVIKTVFIHVPVLIPALFGLFGLLFTTKFLNTKKIAPKLHRTIIIFIWMVNIPVFIAIAGYPHESVSLVQFFGLILALLSIATGITVLRKGYRPAKFYVIGFGAYMLGLLILIVSSAFHLSIGGMENYALEAGSAIEAILLSFAIADKLNMATLEKQEAQLQTLEALRQNEKLVREQNAVLEKKVKERTSELQEQKEIVEEKNKNILDSIRYAKRIQSSLLPSNKFIERALGKTKGTDPS